MRPSKITPEIRKRCEEVADLKIAQRSRFSGYKDLETETGVNRNYLAKVIHEIVAAKMAKPRVQ